MNQMNEYIEAIARDDRRDEMKLRAQVPDDMKDKPWAWDMYFELKRRFELKHKDEKSKL